MTRHDLLRKIYWTAALLVVFILALLASVHLLNPSSVGNVNFVRYVNLWAAVWVLIFLGILVLVFILARNLIKLFFEYQDRHPGSRIKIKLVTTLTLFSFFPAAIMSFLAFGLINRNLRQWFSSPSEQLLHSAQVIGSSYYEEKRRSSLTAARLLARHFEDAGGQVASDLQRKIETVSREHGFQGILLLDQQGEIFFRSGGLPEEEALKQGEREVLSGRDYYSIERQVNAGNAIIDRGVVGVPLLEGGRPGGLLALFVIPQSIAFHATHTEAAYTSYQQIKDDRRQLEMNYISVLALTTLAVVFGFVWLGTYISRKITVPLEALAEGSHEIAKGNLDYRVDVSATDELGIVVDSFNRMVQEIQESRLKLERANEELTASNVLLEQRRNYIETILQNIATGVITIDETETIQTINEAALKMLRTSREQVIHRSIREVAAGDLYEGFAKMMKRARLYGTYRRELTFRRGDQSLHAAATMTANPKLMNDKGQYLIVLDDLSELIKGEKFAAWQEVARRLAHEIKNPLTPIRLFAERLQNRFEKMTPLLSPQKEAGEFEKLLKDAVRIIVAEAENLRSLVEEFSRFARMPIFKPAETSLHDLIEQTLALYDGGLTSIQIQRSFDPRILHVKLDAEQMRRVFINLIDNSLDALAETGAEKSILIRTRLNEARETVTIEFQDNGMGIAAEDYENLFLPYFSTKKKGTGLGLAIVRQIISEHNGFIRAEPNTPRGTKFIMELPLN